jgi:hypothetical protein
MARSMKLGFLLAALSVLALPGASAAGQSPPATQIVKVSPTTPTGELQSGYTVAATKLSAHCEPGSDVLAGVYRCFQGNGVYDPCWASPQAPSPGVLCLLAPWETKVTELNLTAALEPSEPGPLLVWGIQLANGHRCLALQGTHDFFKGRVVNYACGSSGVVLLGRPNRTHASWTIRTARRRHGRYTTGGAGRIAKVWYGLPSAPV